MTHKEFIERLEEILEALGGYFENDPQSLSPEGAEESLITLFEDVVRTIVGEEDTEVRGTTQSPSNPMYWTKRTKHRNELRQTIIKASKTILRGEK